MQFWCNNGREKAKNWATNLPQVESEAQFHSFVMSALDNDGGQRHAPAALALGASAPVV